MAIIAVGQAGPGKVGPGATAERVMVEERPEATAERVVVEEEEGPEAKKVVEKEQEAKKVAGKGQEVAR